MSFGICKPVLPAYASGKSLRDPSRKWKRKDSKAIFDGEMSG